MRVIIEDTRTSGETPPAQSQAESSSMSAPPPPAGAPNYAGAINAGPAPSGPAQAGQAQQPGTSVPSGEPTIVQQRATSAGPAPTDV